MAESPIGPISSKPILSNVGKQRAGIALAVGGALALTVGGLFLAIYFNKGIASSMNLGQLPKSLLGRLSIGLPLAAGNLLVSGGVILYCTNKKKTQPSAEKHHSAVPVLTPQVLNTEESSSDSRPSSPVNEKKDEAARPPAEEPIKRDESPSNLPPASPNESLNKPLVPPVAPEGEQGTASPASEPAKKEPAEPITALQVIPKPQSEAQRGPVKLNSENYQLYRTEIAKSEKEQNSAFLDGIREAVQARIVKAFYKAYWVHERFKELGIKTAEIKDEDHIVVDPRTLIMARETCQGFIEGLSLWLSEEEKSKFLQAVLIGKNDKLFPIKLSSTAPKNEEISIEKPADSSLWDLFSNPFSKSLESAVNGFVEALVGRKNVKYKIDKNTLVQHFEHLPLAERKVLLQKLRDSELHKNTLRALGTDKTLEIPTKLFEKVQGSNADDKRKIELFISEMGSASADIEIQELVTFKYLELILSVGNFNQEQFDKELKKSLDQHANLSHESRSQVRVASQSSQLEFNDRFEFISVTTKHQLEETINSEDFKFVSQITVRNPLHLGKCNLNLFADHMIDHLTSNETILTVGEYLNPKLDDEVRTEIKNRSRELTLKIESYNQASPVAEDELKRNLRNTRLDVALLVTYIRIYVSGTADKFDKADAELTKCLAGIAHAEGILEGLSKRSSPKVQSLIEKHQNHTLVLKAGLKVCLQQTEEVADPKTVRKLKTQKYSICLETMRRKLEEIIASDAGISTEFKSLTQLKDYADRNKKVKEPAKTYSESLWNFGKYIAEKAYLISPEEKDPLNELLICISNICGALVEDRKGDSEDRNYENDTHLNNVRNLYLMGFMPALSHAVGLFEKNEIRPEFSNLRKICYELCYHMYSSIDLDENLYAMLDAFDSNQGSPLVLHRGEPEIITSLRRCYNSFAGLNSSQTAPFLDRTWRSAKNNNHVFYPNHEGNPTHVLFPINISVDGVQRSIIIKAYGSPTVENGKGTAVICNEFKAHLECMKQRKERHMHVTFQNFIPVPSFMSTGYYLDKSDETDRNIAIVDLQDEERFKDCYLSITLAKDSDFYHQKGQVAGLYTSYKDMLLYQFFGHFSRQEDGYYLPDENIRATTGCYIPDKIVKFYGRDREIKVVFNDIADKIHQIMFDGKAQLTVEEKKKFTELFYSAIILLFATEFDLTSLSGICKDMIDRGMMAIVRLYGLIAAANGKAQANRMFERRLKAYTMIRAYLVRKRVPIHERFDRMIEDYTFVLQNQEKIVKLFDALFPGLKISV